ncbi:MAG: integrase arm-type DNA-binding domain-containing protein [Rudaea sp.]|uniref:tyrosine-type recombinase/integrase n=1 Tax=unclassified Rudaea TaxID=2627037 RepID=UPI0010FA206B|nr:MULTISPECIES: integrase arm-type DNA-binding domain-containing protein [unclassified Rudaea]MBN8884618.1 integrase arm-type DNA-binding domain-containing protein [Rudaea sp.]
MAGDKGKLTAVALKSPSIGKHFDSGGLFLHVTEQGGKYWRLKYRFAGKEKLLALGVFPEVSLAEARQRREVARTLLRDGIDPNAERKATVLAARDAATNTFEAIAREWLQKQSSKLAKTTHAKAVAMFETWAFPWIGSRPVAEITPRVLLESVLRRVEAAGKLETVHRLKQRCGQVFRYAIATGRAERDPTPDLRGALETHKPRNHSAITDPTKIGELLRAMDGYQGNLVTRCALRLTPLLFVRPGELRRAEWTEFDLEGAHPQWSIPAVKMKMDAPHIVPLSTQAVAILRELHPLTGRGRYVFPGLHSRARPMSENTVNLALRRLGYSGSDMVAHGFRSMASTLLNEQVWPADVIERQLAHAERNEVRAAYNRAKHLPERRKMMQAWADYLDGLCAGADVVLIRKKAG